MATVPPPPANPGLGASQRDQLHRRVIDPLGKLRSTIRLYVTIHGALLMAIYLALCFWVGLALDYGFFRLFTVDWVQMLHPGLRAFLLILGALGLAAVLGFKVLGRLFRDFRDPALALVLERRFPDLLGDRLITAVELYDSRDSVKYGYSQAMIDQTIQEAAERVDKVPIKDAFNWNRLYRYAGLVVFLTLGMYLVSAVIYFAGGAIMNAKRTSEDKPTKPLSGGNFVSEFNNVSTLWFERNILLRNIIWPRRVHLELVGFPEGDLRVGKNIATAPIRVRSVKWVVADDKAPEGWRAIRWDEVKTNWLGGREKPELPAEWKANESWTVDQVENQIEKDKVELEKERGKMTAEDVLRRREAHERLDSALSKLALTGNDPRMARKFRVLEVPGEVYITYRGDTTRGDLSLKREENNEYSGSFTDLKETIHFEASAEDYSTKPRQITIVPPPTLKALTHEDAHPAYVYHLPPPGADGGLLKLKGLKQHFAPEATHLGGDKSILTLPRGSDIKLTATIAEEKDPEGKLKELREIKLVAGLDAAPAKTPDGKPIPPPALPDAKILSDKRTFVIEFKDLTRPVAFDMQFTDTDGVTGHRQVVIEPLPDTPPKLKVAVDPVIRKTPEGYKITAKATVPFTGVAEDDRGLARLDFHASYTKAEASGILTSRIEVGMLYLALTPSVPGSSTVLATPGLAFAARKASPAEDRANLKTVSLPRFDKVMEAQAVNAVSMETLEKRLHQQIPREPLYKLHKFDQNLELFDVGDNLKDLAAPMGSIQPRHRLELWLVATDNNVENDKGPGITESDEHFNFVIVSEAELLADISGEEAKLYETLAKVQKTILDGKTGLRTAVEYLTAADFDPKTGFAAQSTRISTIKETIKSQRDITEGVHKEYTRLLREMEYNKFGAGERGRLEKICTPLDSAIHKEFEAVDRALDRFQKALDNNKYDPELARESGEAIDELLKRLEEVMNEIGTLLDIQKLVVETQDIKAGVQNARLRLQEIKRILEDSN